jgi:photosystem II stability/assembly factor-like uncharacterized protein
MSAIVLTAVSAAAQSVPPGPTGPLVIDPATPSVLFAGGPSGTFKTEDGGTTWRLLSGLTESPNFLAIDPVTPTTVYAGTSSGVFKTTDGGATWNRAGLTNTYVIELRVDSITPTTIYARVSAPNFSSLIVKSTDGGGTWSNVSPPVPVVTALAIDPLTPTTLYAGTFQGVFKSTDAGATWVFNELSWPGTTLVPYQLVIDPLVPTTLYAGIEGVLCRGCSSGPTSEVWKSTDAGRTWMWVGGVFNPKVIAIDPVMPTTLYVAYSESGCFIDENGETVCFIFGGISKSTDGGYNSAPVSDLIANSLAIDPVTPSIIYAGTNDGIFKSTNGGATWSPTGPITLSISSLTLNPTSVNGGNSSSGTVTLNTAAPAEGAEIVLSRIGGVATVPSSVTVPAGATSADFIVSTTQVDTSTTVSISALYGGVSSYATLTVTPAATLSSLSLNPPSLIGGSASIGTVMLSVVAPAGGATVALVSDNPTIAMVPAAVSITAGAKSATFPVSTTSVSTQTLVTISGTYGGLTKSAVLTTVPVTLSSLSLNPTSLTGGNASTGTVTLNAPAPAGGAVVTLTSSNTAVSAVPTSVTAPAGATTVGFQVTTNAVTSASVITITATLGGVTQSAALTVAPAPALVSISLSPSSVRGGMPSTATIALSAAAPPGGLTVTLSSNHPSIAAVPSSITVAAGATSARVTVSTSRPNKPTDVTISANLANVTRTATLTVRR